MKENRKMIEEMLQKNGEKLEIPTELHPDQMHEFLRQHKEKQEEKRPLRKKHLYSVLALAACFCLTTGILLYRERQEPVPSEEILARSEDGEPETDEEQQTPEEEQESLEIPESSYEEIYACLSQNWEKQGFIEDLDMTDTAGAPQKQEASAEAFGRTNIQVEQIDEADQIKNDGRYLYQIVVRQEESIQKTGIQIVDTKGGLKETAFLDDFESLEEFYVWEDLLIAIENKYYDYAVPSGAFVKGAIMEDMAYREQSYHEISVYRISDRSQPKKLKTFTLQGTYESSRIADGYFYEISRFTTVPGQGEQDYDAYIPSIDGRRMESGRIYCPPDTDSTDYLVLVSMDLSDPFSFADSRAVLAGSGIYYMSAENIYMSWYRSVYEEENPKEGKVQDSTRLLRFSYSKGRFCGQAEGEVPGRVENSFSLDEYEENLRIAVTVQEYEAKEIQDDRTGESLGFDYEYRTEKNALYVLDSSLTVKGRAENLAEDETLRSVRFLEKMAYLVTFRQTDPLFAVDLSDPEHPEVLGELKVSGFSEYLHPYGENLLFGIGMEAEEATGREQGMKLSMFDLSDPAEPKEASRFRLKDYDYSEALWDHRAVLIDPEENIIGFQASGSRRSAYFLFSYKEEAFVQEIKIEEESEETGFYRTRGTFIGDTFYLLREDGSIRAYSRTTGEFLEKMEPEAS